MPTILSSLISTRATNFKRLCHLALEDADVILKDQPELIKKVMSYSNQVYFQVNVLLLKYYKFVFVGFRESKLSKVHSVNFVRSALDFRHRKHVAQSEQDTHCLHRKSLRSGPLRKNEVYDAISGN